MGLLIMCIAVLAVITDLVKHRFYFVWVQGFSWNTPGQHTVLPRRKTQSWVCKTFSQKSWRIYFFKWLGYRIFSLLTALSSPTFLSHKYFLLQRNGFGNRGKGMQRNKWVKALYWGLLKLLFNTVQLKDKGWQEKKKPNPPILWNMLLCKIAF